MPTYTLYDQVTGAITGIGEWTMRLDYHPRYGLLEGRADDDRQYVDLSERDNPVLRDKTPIAPVVDGLTVSSLPIPCAVTVADASLPDLPGFGTEYEIDDGSLEFSATLPGKYRLTFRALHHIPATVELTVP